MRMALRWVRGDAEPVSGGGAGVLLVEVVNADQFPGRVSYLFPVVSGYYRQRGCAVRWVRFGIPTTNLLEHGRDEITLSPGELQELLAIAREHAPALIVLTDLLYLPQMEALAASAPDALLEIMGTDGKGHRLSRERRRMTADPAFVPHYAWEPGNEAAEARESDNVYVLLEGSCGHWAGIERNPVYAALGDARLAGRVGCSFCQSRREDRLGDGRCSMGEDGEVGPTPIEWIERQVRSIAESRRQMGRLPNALLLEQLGSPAVLRACIRAMCANGLAGHTQLLLAARSDQAPRVARVLREHLAHDEGESLTVGIYANGIESFAGADLELFNKGTTPLDSLRAINSHRELARDYRGRFWYTGLSLLLFTPWTTPESLALNAGILRFLRATRAEMGNVFQSRLRMHDDLPITILAERAGLLEDEELDPVMIMNRRKLFTGERAWRFRDERMRPLSRLVLRFDLLAEEARDSLTRQLAAAFSMAGVPWQRPDDLALIEVLECLAEAAGADAVVLEERELLSRALTRWHQRRERRAAARVADRYRVGERRMALDGLLKQTEVLVLSGAIPVMLIDQVWRDEARAAGQVASALCIALIDRMGNDARESGTLIAASSEELIAQARELVRQQSSGDGPGRAHAAERMSLLRGLPECCARASSSRPAAEPLLWAAFSQRLTTPGEVPEDMNPLWIPSIGFVPCEPSCVAARATYDRWLDAVGSRPSSSPGRAWLFSLEGPGDGELIGIPVRRAHDDAVEYASEAMGTGPERVRGLIAEGDSLRLFPGQLLVCRGDKTIGALSASHGLWYSRRSWHAPEWLELARAARYLADDASRQPLMPRQDGTRQAQTASVKLENVLRIVVERLGAAAHGVLVERVCFDGPDSGLSVRMQLEGAGYDLALEPRGDGPSLFHTEHYRVTYSHRTPLTAASHIKRVRLILSALDRVIARHAPELLPSDPAVATRARSSG